MLRPSTTAQHDRPRGTAVLALGALGIVFGDIGTSPIYAVQACFARGLRPDPDNVLGVISLILWSLTVVVSVKYALLVMRADSQGAGGVFSLLALALRAARRGVRPDQASWTGSAWRPTCAGRRGICPVSTSST